MKDCRWAPAASILIRHNFPLDADYDFSVSLLQNIVGYVTGLEYPHKLEISIDGSRVFLAPVGGEEDNRMSDANLGIAKDTLDARLKTRVHVAAGPHAVAVTFLRKNGSESDEPLQPFTRDLDLQNMNGIPLIDHVQITGPFDAERVPASDAQPAADFYLPSRQAGGGDALRQADSSLAHRAAGVSRSGYRTRIWRRCSAFTSERAAIMLPPGAPRALRALNTELRTRCV